MRQFNTDRQFVAQALGGFSQALAEGNDVATLGHGHAQGDHFLALVTHFGDGGVFVATSDRRNVAQLEVASLVGDRMDDANARQTGSRH